MAKSGVKISYLDQVASLNIVRHQQKVTISVIGGSVIDDKVEALAYQVGQLVAKAGALLVCGGLGGAMQAAAKGCKAAGGTTVGLLPGKSKIDANPYIDIALPTTIGYARNAMVACSADIVLALPGSHGTNSEICYGLVYGRPVIDLGRWGIAGMIKVKNLKEADHVVRSIIKRIQSDQM